MMEGSNYIRLSEVPPATPMSAGMLFGMAAFALFCAYQGAKLLKR